MAVSSGARNGRTAGRGRRSSSCDIGALGPSHCQVREGGLEPPCPLGHTALNRAEAAHGRPASSSRKCLKCSRWSIQPGLTSMALWSCPSGSRTSPATFVSTSCPRTRRPAAGDGRVWALYAGHDQVAQRGRIATTATTDQAGRLPSPWQGARGGPAGSNRIHRDLAETPSDQRKCPSSSFPLQCGFWTSSRRPLLMRYS